ncbi:MAG: NADP-dependent oxidoreductase [Janthinobacterium lividum]
MRALVFDRYGPPEVLHVAEMPEPSVGPGLIRVDVRAASVNPVDWKIRNGASTAFFDVTFPAITGLDVAGVVDEVGEGVTEWRVGDEVFGVAESGAVAEKALLAHAARKPATMSWLTAAALPSAAETGLRAVDLLGVLADDVVMINGVAGGVGLAAAQFAMARGAKVLGSASDANHDALRALGIEPVRYGEGMGERVRAVRPNVDRAIDAAGHDALPALLELVGGDPERVITVADGSAAELGIRFTTGAERRYWEALPMVADLASSGRFTMPIARLFTLQDGPAAHQASESGHVLGKLVFDLDAA